MNKSGTLTETNILNLKAKMGNAIKTQGTNREKESKWPNKLFSLVGKNYCKYLDNELILDF